MTRGGRAAVRALLLLMPLAAGAIAEAGPFDPALRFFTLRTPHFRIHYHAGEEALAARLAAVAERAHVRLAAAWGSPPGVVTDVVLADQWDLSNGWASIVPRNQIVISPAPPSGASSIGNTDDWLDYVFTHEYVHVLHLDRSRGWARAARAVFGRTELAFPNLSLPLWQIEGLATLAESGAADGRLHDGDFLEIVDAAARRGRLEPLDRVNGGLVDWPSGHGWYAYGARFHQYLLLTYGQARLRALNDRTAGRLPFLTSGAFRAVFGRPLDALWRDFQAHVAAHPGPAHALADRLTTLGFVVAGPRQAADGSLYFTASDPRRFPGIYRLGPGEATPERVVSRYGGSSLSLHGDRVLFDQLEIVRGAALVSDLYVHDLGTGATRRLSRHARLLEADLSPGGDRIAAVQLSAGARGLVVLDAGRLLNARAPVPAHALPVVARAGGAEDVVATPRWSPDGSLLAVERRRRGGPSTVALLDARTLRTRAELTAPDGARYTQPAFSPDGTTLYFAASQPGEPFQIVSAGLGPGGRITAARPAVTAAGGARAPLPTGQGRVVFVGYGTEGFDLYEAAALEAQPDAAPPGAALDPHGPGDGSTPGADHSRLEGASPYSPWPGMLPAGWLPLVEDRDGRLRLGGTFVAADALSRHVTSARATWAVSGGRADGVPASRLDWAAAYSYQRWQPSFYVAAEDRTTLFEAVTSGGPQPVALRERTADAGVWRAFRRVRHAQTALAAYHTERLSQQGPAGRTSLSRAGVRAGWTFTSAQRYGYSISQQDGVTLAVTGEMLRPALGSDGRSDAVTVDVRAYLPLGLPHAVLAARAAMAAASGDPDVRRRYRLGGVTGNPSAGAFGSDAVSLLRGFTDRVFVGDRVALVNLEARVPLWSIQRGWKTWPLFVRTVHAAGFADAGHAWSGSADWGDRKIGYGLEMSADVVAGFGLPLTWTAGIGWGRDGAGALPPTRAVYVRAGRSF